jgi:hypothetical protein
LRFFDRITGCFFATYEELGVKRENFFFLPRFSSKIPRFSPISPKIPLIFGLDFRQMLVFIREINFLENRWGKDSLYEYDINLSVETGAGKMPATRADGQTVRSLLEGPARMLRKLDSARGG